MSTPTQATYGLHKTITAPLAVAVERVTAALKEQGFGVLTVIDVQKTLKQKLDVDFPPYVILGACNPQLAYQALQVEHDLGLLLPCNVIVYQAGEQTTVSAVDPDKMLGMVNNPALAPIAAEARRRLQQAIDSVS